MLGANFFFYSCKEKNKIFVFKAFPQTKICIKFAPYLHQERSNWALIDALLVLWCLCCSEIFPK